MPAQEAQQRLDVLQRVPSRQEDWRAVRDSVISQDQGALSGVQQLPQEQAREAGVIEDCGQPILGGPLEADGEPPPGGYLQ